MLGSGISKNLRSLLLEEDAAMGIRGKMTFLLNHRPDNAWDACSTVPLWSAGTWPCHWYFSHTKLQMRSKGGYWEACKTWST